MRPVLGRLINKTRADKAKNRNKKVPLTLEATLSAGRIHKRLRPGSVVWDLAISGQINLQTKAIEHSRALFNQ